MTSAELLVDAVGRIREIVHRVVAGLTPEQLAFRLDPEANSIAWLVWHLTRIQDDHLADAFQAEQVWTAGGWMERFGLPFDPQATGYGHQAEDVAAVQAMDHSQVRQPAEVNTLVKQGSALLPLTPVPPPGPGHQGDGWICKSPAQQRCGGRDRV
jgi:hypothetical protein